MSTRADTRARIPRGVWALGFVSLFTDLGSEIVHSLLPLMLVGTLGASALMVGLIEGVAESLVLVTKVFSGYISDAVGKRKPLVVLGYGLAALTKPLFPLAGSIGMVLTARMLDRFGKGIRGAPRDALLAELAPAEIRGASFGLRQSMDTLGAVLGPLAAIGLMMWFAGDIRSVLWFAVIPGVISIAILLLYVREPEHATRAARLPITREGLASLGAGYWRIVAVGALMSLARFSEAFLILRGADVGLPNTYAPLILVVMSLAYTVSAYPAGRLSDRIGRRGVFAAGMLALVVADAVLGWAGSATAVLIGAALWGLHMGLTQGVLTALIADVTPACHRGTAFGAFGLVSGAGLLVASVLAGWLWDREGPMVAFVMGAFAACLALLGARWLPAPPLRERDG